MKQTKVQKSQKLKNFCDCQTWLYVLYVLNVLYVRTYVYRYCICMSTLLYTQSTVHSMDCIKSVKVHNTFILSKVLQQNYNIIKKNIVSSKKERIV